MKNREIKFRGLTKDGKWKYGFLGFNPIEGQFYIHEVEDIPPTYANPGGDIHSERYDIEPETIGQFTGLKDKNDNDIYEGDIVKVTDDNGEVNELNSDTGIGRVEFNYGMWYITDKIENSLYDIHLNLHIEIVVG